MRSLGTEGLLSDRRRGSRRPKTPIILAVLAVIAVVGYAVIFLDREDDEPDRETRRIDRLETPAWQSSELNRPTLGQVDEDDAPVEELAIVEDTDDPLHLAGQVVRNQTLFVTLRNRGLLPDRIQPVVNSMSKVFDFRRSRPGDRYEARLDLDGNILEFRYQTSPEDIFLAQLVGDQYVAEKVEVPKEVQVARVAGVLSASLFQTFTDLGEKSEAAQRFMDLFAFDFDFGSDSQVGDTFRMVIEKIYLDGEFYKYGNVLAAEYVSADRTFTAYAFDTDKSDEEPAEYYDEEGYALKRMFIIAPVRNAKMTSGFNLKRFHPILKRVRPHLGVDWAAPTGTPIMAAADGVIEFVGWKGGNGNLIVVKHNETYTSIYAHLHRFARGMKKGREVRQQEVIGYVGTTGLSTAPHLHYGLKKNGEYMDPFTLDTSRGDQLPKRHLKRFEQRREELKKLLEGDQAGQPPPSEKQAPAAPEKVAPANNANPPAPKPDP